jgi:excisionase family DNA binding protein
MMSLLYIIASGASLNQSPLLRICWCRLVTLKARISNTLTEVEPMREHNQPKLQIEPLLVRVEEAARILCLSRSTIYQMLDRGELPSIRCGAARRIPIAALRAWVERQMATIDS